MIGFFRGISMRRRQVLVLKDEEIPLLENTIQSLKRKLSALHESQADRLLGISKRDESNSFPAVSGGRPESNRRKF
jgi:hypothetical protein